MAFSNNGRFNNPSDLREIALCATVCAEDSRIVKGYLKGYDEHPEDDREFRSFRAMARYNVGVRI